jgi:hypothetical protein
VFAYPKLLDIQSPKIIAAIERGAISWFPKIDIEEYPEKVVNRPSA